MLTQSEAESAGKAEQQQPPQLLKALLGRGEAAALSQLLPHRQSAGQVHPAATHNASPHATQLPSTRQTHPSLSIHRPHSGVIHTGCINRTWSNWTVWVQF